MNVARVLKDSKIAWIERLPDDWDITRIKNLALSMLRGVQPQYAEATNFYIANQACLSTYRFRSEKRKECEPLSGKKGFYKQNDILIASTGEGVLGKCVLADHQGFADSHISILRLNTSHSPAFLTFLLTVNYELLNSFYAKGSTKQTELQRNQFLAHSIAIPSYDQQCRIANWLDHQTARIDKRRELLAKKRELLHELRKSLVHEKVCKRVNQSRETVRIKEVAKINPSTRLPRIGSVEFYPMDAIGVDGGLTAGQFKDVSGATGYSQFKNGDVLFAKVTPCFENGKSAIAERVTTQAALATTEVIVLRPNKKISPQFLHYRLKARDFADMGKSEMKGAGGLKRVPEKHVANFCFELPNKNEQQAIVDFLDRKQSQIDRQITLIDQLDDLLKEQRKALIHEAVTGKIDLSSAPLGSATVV